MTDSIDTTESTKTEKTSPGMQGGCLCGAIRYKLVAQPKMTAVCHCTHCQRQSGSFFSVNLICALSDYEQEGETATYLDSGDSGLPVLRHFCSRCGSSVRTDASSMPGLVIVKAGTLDEPWTATPSSEVYTIHSAPWVPRIAGAMSFEQGRR